MSETNPATEIRPWYDSVLAGVGLMALLHVAVFGTIAVLSFTIDQGGFFFVAVLGVGLVQIPYAAVAYLAVRRFSRLAIGVLVGAGITLFLNLGCYGSILLVGISAT